MQLSSATRIEQEEEEEEEEKKKKKSICIWHYAQCVCVFVSHKTFYT